MQLTTHRKLRNVLLVCEEPSKASENGEARTTDEPGSFDCSWDEIIQLLDNAKAEHNERGKRKIHKADTLASQAIPWANRAVEMLPDQYGLSILRGGLKVIFAVSADWQRMSRLQRGVYRNYSLTRYTKDDSKKSRESGQDFGRF